jgi:hypothetical protein
VAEGERGGMSVRAGRERHGMVRAAGRGRICIVNRDICYDRADIHPAFHSRTSNRENELYGSMRRRGTWLLPGGRRRHARARRRGRAGSASRYQLARGRSRLRAAGVAARRFRYAQPSTELRCDSVRVIFREQDPLFSLE